MVISETFVPLELSHVFPEHIAGEAVNERIGQRSLNEIILSKCMGLYSVATTKQFHARMVV